MLIYLTQITKKGTIMKYFSALISIIFSMTIFSQEYPDMPDIPEELRGKMPMSKMFGMKEEKEFESIEEFLEDGEYELIDGFLKIYKETETDNYFLQISEENLNQEFIYFAYVLNAPQAAGVRGGAIGSGAVLEFRKFKDRLALYKKNTYFSNEGQNNIGKQDLTNIIEAFLSDFSIVVKENDQFIISADELFLSEMLTSVSPNIPPEYRDFVGLNLGRLDKSKTFVNEIKNYEKNTSVEVSFNFTNPSPNSGRAVWAVADPRFTFILARHLFVEMPDSNFEPRVADQRVGYFSERITDLNTYDNYPARDLINKWRLEKKDPMSELSEPINPIVFWVEKSTPEEIKPMVVEGIEAWNFAFERAGFKNAVVAKIQPDDSDWDAGDIRYNVVRWSNSPEPAFSGYGPSIANPRTGELIAADIVQEFNAIKRGYTYRKLWGWSEERDPLREWIVSLTMHEVGHTIGLRHNFSASYLYSPDEIHDVSVTGNSTISSIMDYDPINIAPPGTQQGKFFPTEPGKYDKWVIEFGYKPNLSDTERDDLLALSVNNEYLYGPDEDAMGRPGSNIDPRAKRYDMTNDVIRYAQERFIIIDNKISELDEIFNEPGDTKNDFASNFYSLIREKGRFMESVAIQIGGIYVTKLVNGQDDVNAYEPVPYEKQKAAMNLINEQFLANNIWSFDPKILKNLQREKRAAGSYSRDSNEDPRLHEMVLDMQSDVLGLILHPTVMTRLVDSSVYGNQYMPSEVLGDLLTGIFVKNESPDSFKRNLQSKFVDALLAGMMPTNRSGSGRGSSSPEYDEIAKAAIFDSLRKVQKFTRGPIRDAETKKHYAFLNWKVSQFLDQS